MKPEEFRDEILQYIDQAYSECLKLQGQITEMYKVFHEVCKRNHIHCYFGFGSLLGIVRDQGMIPWDADIDVLIPVSEAKHLIEVLQRELPEDYYVISNFTDKNYYLCESRVCQKGYDPEVVHIDIFYLIGAPANPKKRKKFDQRVKRLFYYRAIRNEQIHISKEDTTADRIIYCIKKGLKFVMHIEPDQLLNKRCDKLLFKYDYCKSEYCIVWAVGGEIFPVSIFEPFEIYQKGDFECYLPNDADTFLRIRYSNYHQYFPISDRFEEFYANYKKFYDSMEKNGEN